MSQVIGTGQNQVPLNGFLGTMAFQSNKGVNITGGTAVLTSSLVNSPIGTGYAIGAGGAVTQLTSRTTGVTINTPTGAITLFSAAGSVTAATFTVTNSGIVATDTVNFSQRSGTNLYLILVTAVTTGSFNVSFFTTGGTATDAPVFNFAILKGATA